ncbi:hypothetical protein DV702_14635 [Sporosarcina sp. PTS2304]|nr:hypothetical protein DV702_14635 [Sporosarcina sp. PTS2304]
MRNEAKVERLNQKNQWEILVKRNNSLTKHIKRLSSPCDKSSRFPEGARWTSQKCIASYTCHPDPLGVDRLPASAVLSVCKTG